MSFDIASWQTSLQSHYQSVAETMQSLPIYHEPLTVEVTPMTPIQTGRYLGGLITPWFMSWVFKLVDEAGEDRHAQQFSAKVGQVVTLRFPSGEYEFIVNHQPHLGFYYTCSLISDMHTLPTQAVAQAVMAQSLQYLFDAEVKAETARQGEIRRYATTGAHNQTPEASSETPAETPDEKTVTSPSTSQEAQTDSALQNHGSKKNKAQMAESHQREPQTSAEKVALSRRRLFGLRAEPEASSSAGNRAGRFGEGDAL